MLIKQQDRIEDRVQDIEEQLYKLESDKCLMEVSVSFSSIDSLNVLLLAEQLHPLQAFNLGRSSCCCD